MNELEPQEDITEGESLEDVSPSFRGGNKKPSTKEKGKEKAKNVAQKPAEEAAKKGVKALAKQAARAVASWAASTFSAAAAAVGWPWLVGCLVIFLIIMLIFGGLFCVSSNGYFGKTALVKLNPKTDKRLVLKALAAGKDQAAKRELIVLDTIDTKDSLKNINPDGNAEAQDIINQINQLLDELMALADSDPATLEKIKQILTLLDKLKTLLASQADSIEKIKSQATAIQKMIEFYNQGHLVFNPKDMDYIRNYDVDKRIVQMLVYLITPQDQGGAGYERIKVKRIKFSYDTERKSPSKETDYSDKEEPNISAHYTGQAADITEIDDIKCTQIKRRRALSDKKSEMAPIPIKVAWQTEQGFMKGNGLDAYGQNMHQVFNNFGKGAVDEVLIGQISDIIGVDLDPDKLKGKTLPEISRYVGTAILKESLDIPGDYDLGNNLEDITNNVGRAYLAQALNVPIDSIKGSSPEELTENVGRSTTEAKMSLPPGSLEGNNSNEIFASAGKRYMENSLGLSRNTLSITYNGQDDFKRVLGQGKIESSLGLKSQTFYGSSTNDVKKHLGEDTFKEIFANPQTIDNWLGLSTGTTQSFLDDQISPSSYQQRVGEKVYSDQLAIYQKEEKRAEVFNISMPDMTAFTQGNPSVFTSIGKTTIAKNLTVSDEEQDLLLSWFNTKQLPEGLDEDYLAGQYGLKNGDLGKIFVDDNSKAVYERTGKVEILNNLSQDSQLSSYIEPIQDYQFYKDRLNTIKDNFEYLETKSSDPAIRSKAAESKNIVNQILTFPSIKEIKKNTKQLQTNIKFIQEQAAKTDPTATGKIKEIQKAVNEIIEGREMTDFNNLSPDSITAKTDPQVGLTKKDIYNLITGRASADSLIYNIGIKKWEIELDLPNNSLKNAFSEIRTSNFKNANNILFINIGKSRFTEYGGLRGKGADEADKDLGLPSGTTADYQSGKITEQAYYKKIGMGKTNNIAANYLNQQFDLEGDPNYALQGTDVANLLNGGWFFTVLKIGGRAIDESFGLPAGGTLDVIQQTDNSGDVLGRLAELKLGVMAGLNHAVSISGDITYNLGRVKIEQELGLKPNELDDNNAADKIRGYTGSNKDSLSILDVTFGIKAGESKKLIDSQISGHDYIKEVGNSLQNNVFLNQIANYAPIFKDQDVKTIALAFANKTGTPEEILQAAGANQVGRMLGLDYPVSIRGNFKDNLGQAKIEDRLGLKRDSFKDNIDNAIKLNTNNRFESAFYIDKDQLSNARNLSSGYWDDTHKNKVKIVDAVLNIPVGSTQSFITGQISLAEFVDKVGQSSVLEVGASQLTEFMGLDDDYKSATETLVSVFNSDPTFSSQQSKQQLYGALLELGGWNLDSMTKFDPGTWEKIFFTDPNNPEHTGLKNADIIILEQGKKWLPQWMGMDKKYDPWIDIIYEQGLEQWGRFDQNEAAMVSAIQEATGIPNEDDAKRFLTGDYKGGATAWGAAQIVKIYNDEFKDQDATLDYNVVKTAYFNNPTGEKTIGDAAVASARQKAGVATLSPAMEKTIRQDAIRDARDSARKDVQFRASDVALHKADQNIPAGFTQAMREGTPEQKWGMGLQYVGNMVHSQNPEIPADILPDLQKYFDSGSTQYHDPAALSNSAYSFLDGQMKEWFGDFIQTGTAKALFSYGQTGHLGQPNEAGTLTNIYANYGINIVANWADKTLNLPTGTTKMVYDYYTEYKSALDAYNETRALYNAGKATQQAVQEKEAAVNNIEANAITMVITYAFQKQLLAVDQQLGLVPGSSAMLVGMAVQQWILGAISPWTIGLFVLTNLFGVYRIDVNCTACGYYPGMEPASQSCPLGEFDGKSSTAFQTNSIEAAQYKINRLIGDILNMPTALKDNGLRPTQIMTLRQEDVDSYSSQINSLYGGFMNGNMGTWSNELMWDHIHIGY